MIMTTQELRNKAISMYSEGLSPVQIANVLNTSIDVLTDLVSKYITF